MRVFSSIDEVRASLGTELGPTASLIIDQARIDAFARTTGDGQWIHVDPDRAVGGPYGATIAHGFLTLSLIPYFARELFELTFCRARINYGLDKVRFPAPVPVGSGLCARATFVGLEEKGAAFMLTTEYVVEAEGASRPACVARTLVQLA